LPKSCASQKRFVVAFSNFMDETAATADLIVPVQMALETWDAYESNTATMATLQPTMGKITQAPALGELLINLLPPDKRPAADYKALVSQTVMAGQRQSNCHRLAENHPERGPICRRAPHRQRPQGQPESGGNPENLPGDAAGADCRGHMCSWRRPPSAFSTAGAPTGPG
jgi:hypothetical protein